ncbi:DUF3348 domain-containing protein [Trinickia terrae]|uniref:DUF3348 domain-containing protein n=1 Tax=Trinickia terrae TaxID=2571161 RepID=A0A4U1HJX1_9BURK|nr:DUF3348 domain-containing protein [Trinickia terrae]TKC79897.1 DUF3348 domain-containing protein [Trinickia terrae]
MLQAPQRTAFSGPTLVRLLARLADADVPEPAQSLSDRLSQWLGWTDAIALSSALNGNPPAVASRARADVGEAESLCLHARSALTKSIVGGNARDAAKRSVLVRTSQDSAMDATVATVDYADFRQRYLSMQQAMEMEIGNLRGRLRGMLAAKSPAMAKLAVVDATMERALGPRERSLLASVPALLAAYFERLRETEQQTLADAESSGDTAAVKPGAWLNVFRKDMQSVLLAELEVRFQPVEGLLAALRS